MSKPGLKFSVDMLALASIARPMSKLKNIQIKDKSINNSKN